MIMAGLDLAVLAALPVAMAFVARGMVPKSHALPGHNRSQALKRHGQRNHNRKQANEP